MSPLAFALGIAASIGIALSGVAAEAVLAAKNAAIDPPAPNERKTGFEFIDTGFENASPLWYEIGDDGSIQVHLLYDHERSSPNRAAGHFHFQLQAGTARPTRNSRRRTTRWSSG